ncbi:MAG: glycosyltransferase [Roseovarius sp.]
MWNLSKKKPAVCFVTNELYPENNGGIGRILYNFAVHNREAGRKVDIHFVVGGDLGRNAAAISRLTAAFKRLATIHVAPDMKLDPDTMTHLLGYAAEADKFSPDARLADSFQYYLGILKAQRAIGQEFELVEFPDFGGWGKVSMEAKRAGLAFANTTLGVRVHSTQGILYRVERYAHVGGAWIAGQFDAEEFSLAHADMVVGHIPSILDYTLAHYGLQESLGQYALCEFPPIAITEDEARSAKGAKTAGDSPDFIFSSRLQEFKRPDLFVRAAVAFMDRNPDYTGVFRIVSYGWDEDYIAMLKDLVPEAMAKSILFILDATPQQRLEHIGRSVVVQPSDYESLCLFAYEASSMGRPVILNGACLAFGSFDRWQDGHNCLLFDGTVDGLVATMEKARGWTPAANVDTKPDAPYWFEPAKIAAKAAHAAPAPATFTTVFFGASSTTDLRTIRRNVSKLAPERCILLINRADDFTTADLAPFREIGVEIRVAPGQRFDPDELQKAAMTQPEEVVLLVPAGVQLTDEFLEQGACAIHEATGLDMVGAHLEVRNYTSGVTTELKAYHGQAPNIALMHPRIMSPFLFLRKPVLERIPFDFTAGPLWFEAFSRSAALEGERMCILPIRGGQLDSQKSMRQENSKKLTSTLLDASGMRAGLPARLLSVEIPEPPRSDDSKTVPLTDSELSKAIKFSPTAVKLTWKPVEFHHHLGGLLVHPLEGFVTVGILPLDMDNPFQVEAMISNANKLNQGGEAAIAFGSVQTTEKQLLDAIAGETGTHGLSLGKWVSVPPGHSVDYTMPLRRDLVAMPGKSLFLLSRVEQGKSADHCHIVFGGVKVSQH